MPKALTSKRSHRERTAVERLYKYAGARKVSFYYQYPDGSNETLASADAGDRAAVQRAERTAMRRARELQEGKVVVGSVSELIDRFQTEIAPKHFRDQSNDGLAVRNGELANLVRFFGKMSPEALRPLHGYQYLEARANSGAPAKANKELSLMSTICNFAVRWGLIETNPFIRLMRNRTDKRVRVVTPDRAVFTCGRCASPRPSATWAARPCSPTSPAFALPKSGHSGSRDFVVMACASSARSASAASLKLSKCVNGRQNCAR